MTNEAMSNGCPISKTLPRSPERLVRPTGFGVRQSSAALASGKAGAVHQEQSKSGRGLTALQDAAAFSGAPHAASRFWSVAESGALRGRLGIGHWNLVILWTLVIGHWS